MVAAEVTAAPEEATAAPAAAWAEMAEAREAPAAQVGLEVVTRVAGVVDYPAATSADSLGLAGAVRSRTAGDQWAEAKRHRAGQPQPPPWPSHSSFARPHLGKEPRPPPEQPRGATAPQPR